MTGAMMDLWGGGRREGGEARGRGRGDRLLKSSPISGDSGHSRTKNINILLKIALVLCLQVNKTPYKNDKLSKFSPAAGSNRTTKWDNCACGALRIINTEQVEEKKTSSFILLRKKHWISQKNHQLKKEALLNFGKLQSQERSTGYLWEIRRRRGEGGKECTLYSSPRA